MQRHKLIRRACQVGCMGLVLGAATLMAQRVIELRGFKYSEYYDAPQETRIKTRMEGAKAQPLPEGSVLVTQARVQTFRPDGLPELVVEAPECLHSPAGHTISGSGPILVKTADGSFSIHGDGFLFQQTNSTLIISNNVETIASPELLSQGAKDATPDTSATPLRINARTFRYSADDSTGLYRGDVQVAGTNLSLSSGRLVLKLPIEERRLRSIVAEEQVQLDYAGINAEGQKAVYDVDTELAEVTGNPTWSSQGRKGGADEFTIDRTNRLVFARGNAWLNMPGQSLAGNLLPPGGTAPAADNKGKKSVEVRSDRYELRTNQIAFSDAVKVTEFSDGTPNGQLTCDKMLVTFSGTNQLENLEAEQDVIIERGDARFTADKAVYASARHLLELRGNPRWEAGARRGKGTIIDVDTARSEMLVKGNASMQMPAAALREQAGSKLKPGSGSAEPPAEVFSEEYVVGAERALFKGGVYITHPQMAWSCETLAVDLPPQGQHVERVLAEQRVAFNFMDNSGQMVQGKAQEAQYDYKVLGGITNEQMKLSGNPIIETTNGTFRNPVIIYDLTQDKIQAKGHYTIRGIAPALNTNRINFPK